MFLWIFSLKAIGNILFLEKLRIIAPLLFWAERKNAFGTRWQRLEQTPGRIEEIEKAVLEMLKKDHKAGEAIEEIDFLWQAIKKCPGFRKTVSS